MLFPTIVFLFLFLPIVLAIYYGVLKNREWRNYFLTLVSLVFYAWGEPFFIFLMLGSIIFNKILTCRISHAQNQGKSGKPFLILAIALNLGILFCAKYLAFTMSNLNLFFNLNVIVPYIGLPLGISFFTFQAMSYVIDVYWKRVEAEKSFMNVCLYIALFPQLVAGPIVRYTSIASQILNRHENWDFFSSGVCRFILGMAKKIIIADAMGVISARAFDLQEDVLSCSMAWIGSIAFTFQIYFDFSGYSDMAIGLAKMFGFSLPENFNYPMISKSATDFWRRWHISLSAWFRDYVYIPLGGNRVSRSRLIFNLFIVWLCTGIWHGANWTFVVWGLYYFLLLTFEKLTHIEERKWFAPFAHIYTLLIIIFGWTIFNAKNLTHAIYYFKSMFSFDFTLCDCATDTLTHYTLFLIAAALLSLPIYTWTRRYLDREDWYWQILNVGLHTTILVWTISLIVQKTFSPFIYQNF